MPITGLSLFLGPWNDTATVSTHACRTVPGEQELPHRSVRAQPGASQENLIPALQSSQALRAGLEQGKVRAHVPGSFKLWVSPL